MTEPAAPETPASVLEKVKFYIAQEGLATRDGGPYLDQVERESAEVWRAKVEEREPDFENASATAGTPLVTFNKLIPGAPAEMDLAALEEKLSDDLKSQELDVDTATGQEEETPPAEAPAVAAKKTAAPATTSSSSS
jgi:hypothetical protein